MKLSIALILDELGLEPEGYVSGDHNPTFASAELYVAGDQHQADQLLVGFLSEVIAGKGNKAGLHFLCIRDRLADELETPDAMEGILIVKRNIDLRDLHNRIQRIFTRTRDWAMSMERNLAQRGGLQELLDLAEPIFQNFITIQDSAFKLLAYTKNIQTTDAIMNRLVEYGYHPKETMEAFRNHRRLEQFKTMTDVIVSRDRLTSVYDIVKKTFHVKGALYLLLVMCCNKRDATASVVELFGLLAEYVQAYIDQETVQLGGGSGIKALVQELVTKSVVSKEEANNRAENCNYPYEGKFRLCQFSFPDEENVPTARIVQSLMASFGGGVAFPDGKYVLLLLNEPLDANALCERIERSVDYADFRCGISDMFACLWELPAAFEQAKIATDISARINNPKFAFFSGLLIHHLVYAGYSAAPDAYEDFFTKIIDKLHEYDEQRNTNIASVLRLYLENERRATAVSALLHMHRNTVIYHIEKIESLYGVSFEDSDVRLRFLLAFKADDFKKKQ